MTKEKFEKELRNRLDDRFPDSEIDFRDIKKNNSVILRGFTLKNKNDISPIIYINEYYNRLDNGLMTIDEVVDTIVDCYEKYKVDVPNKNFSSLIDFENCKNRILIKLINTKRNTELLKDIPSIPVLDLSVIFVILVSSEDFGTATITITNQIFGRWEITKGELYSIAKMNTVKQGIQLMSLADVIKELKPDALVNLDLSNIPMYVLGNKNKIHGASIMVIKPELKKIARKIDCSFYILPSSIHELIILPYSKEISVDELRSMVYQINRTEVLDEDVLSDSVYYYDISEDTLSIA